MKNFITVAMASVFCFGCQFFESQDVPWWSSPGNRIFLEYDAGLRDEDIVETLIAIWDSEHELDDPNFNVTLSKSEHPQFFPSIVGVSQYVSYDVTHVVKELVGPISFAAAYRDEAGQLSTWAKVVAEFDQEVNAVEDLRIRIE